MSDAIIPEREVEEQELYHAKAGGQKKFSQDAKDYWDTIFLYSYSYCVNWFSFILVYEDANWFSWFINY